jgi:transcription initiation factor TFIID subunit 13
MTEPRARPRTKGQLFHTSDLTDLLYAYGTACRTPTTQAPLSSTIAVLDEILTDFIIETCHAAALSASYSRRQKIKVDDFKFVLRKDPALLGRVQEEDQGGEEGD